MDMTVVEGRDTVLTCIARGFPSPMISWYRGSGAARIELSGTVEPVTVMDGFFVVSSRLPISLVNRQDTDVYSCVAVNDVFGSTWTEIRNIHLTVNCKCTTNNNNNNFSNSFFLTLPPFFTYII